MHCVFLNEVYVILPRLKGVVKSDLMQIGLNEKHTAEGNPNAGMLNKSEDRDLCNYKDNI